jgi:hypothetical protein
MEGRVMVSSADVTERLMARFEGTVPLTTVGEVVRRVLREHHGLLPPSMSAVEAAAAVRLERLAAGQGTGPMP